MLVENTKYEWPMPKNLVIPKVSQMIDGAFTANKRLLREHYKSTSATFPKYIPKNYALGFRITREMVEDDLYGDIMVKKGKKKLVLKISYSVDVEFQEITRTGDRFNIPSMSLTIEDTKQLVKALNLLLKVKTPTKKIVKRRRRVKK